MMTPEEKDMLKEVHETTLILKTVLLGVGVSEKGLAGRVTAIEEEQEKEKSFRIKSIAILGAVMLLLEPAITWLLDIFHSGRK